MRQKSKIRGRIATVLLAAALLLTAGCSFGKKEPEISAEPEVSQADLHTVEWKGTPYMLNPDLETVLFLGIDQDEAFQDEYLAGDSGQADCILLLVFDKTTEEAQLLQINRNTMAELTLYDLNGNQGGYKEGQICLQYAYNIGGSSSCWSMVQTVGTLLNGINIDGYFAMDMAGIAEVNDALGGVDVTLEADYTEIDPSYTEGATVHLEGKKAEEFVRYRDLDTFASVDDRMDRQVAYISAMIDSLQGRGTGSLYDTLSPYLDTYILTNLSADHVNALTTYDYQMDAIVTLPGETKQGEIYEEYDLDEEALMDLVIETFYIEAE